MVLTDKDSGSEAAVKADEEKRRINLWVTGPRRKEYLHFLWYSLLQINGSFEKLKVSERVPMPDEPQHTADYETLLKYAERGINKYIPEGSDTEYNVHELLGQVQPDGAAELLQALGLVMTQPEKKESFMNMMDSLVELKPGAFGCRFNVNEAFKRIRDAQKRK